MQTRTAWQLRGRFGTYILVHRRDLWAGELPVGLSRISADLGETVAHGFARSAVQDLDKAVAGDLGVPHHAEADRGHGDDPLARILAALRQGRLVALQNHPAGGGGSGGGAATDPSAGGDSAGAGTATEEAAAAVAAGAAAGAAAAGGAQKTFLEIMLVDQNNNPVPRRPFKIKLPDGSTKGGNLDEQGFALVADLDPGQCQVTFPDMDGREWKKR